MRLNNQPFYRLDLLLSHLPPAGYSLYMHCCSALCSVLLQYDFIFRAVTTPLLVKLFTIVFYIVSKVLSEFSSQVRTM